MEDGRPEGRRGSRWLYRPGLHGVWQCGRPVDADVVGVARGPVRVGNLGEGKVQRQALALGLALQGTLGEWTREAKSQSPMGTKASNEFEG